MEQKRLGPSSRTDSYRTCLTTVPLSGSSLEEQEADFYEVESHVPLPCPYPLSEHLDGNNSVIINISIFHFIHEENGHLLKLISKISLPTPPYSVSIQQYFNNVVHCIELEMQLSL